MHQAEPTPQFHVAQFSLFVSLALYCLLWGIALHVGRLFEVSFSTLGLIVTIVSFFVLSLYSYRCHLRHNQAFGKQPFLFCGFSGPILKLAFVAGLARLFHSSESSDTLQLTIGAAHHSFSPDKPLGFEMTGHMSDEANVTYFISHVTEYISGYIAHLSGLHIVTVSYHILPALVTALGVLSLYMMMMAFGFSQRRSFFLTIMAVTLLALNLGNGYFGEWSLRRSETTRSYFTVFILHILVMLFALRYRHKTLISNASVFLFIFGICFTSKSTPFLVIATTSLLWASHCCQHLFFKRQLALPSWDLYVTIISAASLLPLYASLFPTADLYQYQLLAWDIRGFSGFYANFIAHLHKVFGQDGYLFVLLVIGVICHGVFLIRQRVAHTITQEQSGFLFFYAALYVLIVGNPVTFHIFKELTPTYVVYFRFFYSLPVIAYFVILFATYNRLAHGQLRFNLKTLRSYGLLGLFVVLFITFGAKDSKNIVINKQFKSAYYEQKPEIDSTAIQEALSGAVHDFTLFAYRNQSFRHGVYSPELSLLVSKNQFLPLYRNLEDSILIDKAQHALEGNSRVKNSDLVALHEALETFKPALVIAKIASLKQAQFTHIMSENNYVQRLIKNKDVMYQRLP